MCSAGMGDGRLFRGEREFQALVEKASKLFFHRFRQAVWPGDAYEPVG